MLALALGVGCATQAPMERHFTDMRRQVEVSCMKTLMDQGLPLMQYGEAMTAHCRNVARQAVR